MPALLPATPSRFRPPGAAVAVVLVALVALLQFAAFAWYVPGNDWARDLFMAARIVDGGEWPARGPRIGGLFHTGPLWYFLVALPVALGAGFTATTLFVGALATAKIPLAARLGWRLGGTPLALPFAALVAVPGWGIYESLQLTHTALLPALAIAAMLPLLTLWRDGGARQWIVSGVLAGLAVQAHPVAGVLAVPALVVAWRRRARWRGDVPAMLAGVAIALLPAVPMLVAEARDGWPALAAIAAVPASPPRAFGAEAFALARALTVGAIGAMRDWTPASWHPVVPVLGGVLAAAWLGSLRALAADPAARRRAGLAAALFAVACVWLLAVRARVPFYMAAIAMPVLAFVLAQGFAAAGGAIRGIGVGAALVLAAIAPLAVIATTHRGHAAVALASIHDIRTPSPPRVPVALLPMWAFDAQAARACGHAAVRVHGELGALVDFYQGRPFDTACAAPVAVQLGGEAGAAGTLDWAGATPHTLRVLGHAAPTWDAAFALAPRRVIAPQVPVDVAAAAHYPHRVRCIDAVAPHVVAFAAAADEAVAIHSPLFAFDRFVPVEARRDGVVVEPASRSVAGAIFLPAGDAGHAWTLRYTACDTAAVDVVTLPVARP